MCMLSSSWKHPDVFVCVMVSIGEGRGLVAAGNQIENTDGSHKQTFVATTETIKKPTTETITNNMCSCHDGSHNKKQRWKPVLKTPNTRNHSRSSKMLNPPAMAESIEHPATETMTNVVLPRRKPSTQINISATTETIKKNNQRRRPYKQRTIQKKSVG